MPSTLDSSLPLPAGAVLPDYGDGGLYGFARGLRNWLHDRKAGWPAAEVAPGERALVVLLVIDGLGDRFLDTVGRGSALHAARSASLSSVCPSTTASAITTLAAFRLLPRLFPVAPMYRHACRPVTLVSPANIAFSRFSLHHGRGAHIEAYEGLDDCVAAIIDMADALAHSGGLIHAYYPVFDLLSHEHGCRSPEAIACFTRVDAAFALLQRALAGRGVRLLVTADHGFIDAPPERRIDLAPDGEVAAMFAAPLFGERRLAFCRVRAGAQAEFEAWAAGDLRGKGVAVRSEDFLAAGLLGPGQPHPRLAERLGSHALLMEAGWTIVDHVPGEHEHTMIGVHGGLSADEMRVPLILART